MILNTIKFLLFLNLILVIPYARSGEVTDLSEYYNSALMGERNTSNYLGPLDPRSESTLNGLIFLDDTFKEKYLNQQIQESPFFLHEYWFNEIVEKSSCPDSILSKNMEYIRYLYRLVTLSYLFEGLKLNNKITNQLGDRNICSITFKDVFQGCSPQSSDMKMFHERVYGKFVNELDKKYTNPFSKKEISDWLDDLQSSTSLTSDPIFSRLHDWCIINKKNCKNLTVEEIKKALGRFCNDDKNLMKIICDEKDNFYGFSSINTPTDIIKKSNAFNLINQSGMGEECLRRYRKLLHLKESPYTSLIKQYPLIYSFLLKKKTSYVEGELFLPGALKEFDMKGLSDFLSALKPPKAEPTIFIKPKDKPVPKPKVVAAIVPKVEVALPVIDSVVESIPEKPPLSEFEYAIELMSEKKLSSYSLNMDKFRDDFEFTSPMIAELSGPIKKFQTRSALSDMKSYDLLGKEEAPVGLVFLKFLIDTENHQGLYNIVTILGDKFFVSNDIEKKSTAHLIQLKNDASTNNRWTIIILKK